MIIEIVADNFFLYIANRHQCNLFTMYSFFNIIIIIIIILVYFPFVYIKSIIKTSHDQTNYKENWWQYKSN